MWSVTGVDEFRLPADSCGLQNDGITMDDEMNLDGAIVSAAFDDTLDLVSYGKNQDVDLFQLSSR